MRNRKNQHKLYKYDLQCSACKMRHPNHAKKCFVCGSDKLVINKIKIKMKKKSSGASIKINIGR